jgi:hypothetical protein
MMPAQTHGDGAGLSLTLVQPMLLQIIQERYNITSLGSLVTLRLWLGLLIGSHEKILPPLRYVEEPYHLAAMPRGSKSWLRPKKRGGVKRSISRLSD